MASKWVIKGWCAWHSEWGMMANTFAETRQAAWELWKVRMFNCPRVTAQAIDIAQVEVKRLKDKKSVK